LTHVSLKLLELNQKDSQAALDKGLTEKSERFQKMRSNAAQFDVEKYFRKLATHQLVFMYTHLLGQYKVNSPHVNHRVLAMLLRIGRTVLAKPEVQDSSVPINPLGTKLVTLEPMLYQIQLLMVLQKILEDPSLTMDEKDHKELILFATNLMHRFWTESKTNPMLFVECLFRPNHPHRHCDLMRNQYVSEELRMVAEKDILLEEAQRFREESLDEDEEAGGAARNEDDDDGDDEDDDENEFDATFAGSTEDDDTGKKSKKRKKSKKAKRKQATRALEDDSDDEDNADSAGEENGDAVKTSDKAEGSSENSKDDEEAESVEKSKPAARKSTNALEDDSSDDEEIEFTDNAQASSKASKGDDDAMDTSEKPKSASRKSINAFEDDDSDDEEMEFNDSSSTTQNSSAPASRKSKVLLDDDSDDDDEEKTFEDAEEQPPASKAADEHEEPSKEDYPMQDSAEPINADKDDATDTKQDRSDAADKESAPISPSKRKLDEDVSPDAEQSSPKRPRADGEDSGETADAES